MLLADRLPVLSAKYTQRCRVTAQVSLGADQNNRRAWTMIPQLRNPLANIVSKSSDVVPNINRKMKWSGTILVSAQLPVHRS